MIDSVLHDPFPARGGPRHVTVGAERVENGQRGVAITLGPGGVTRLDEPGEIPQARGGDGGGRAVVEEVWTGRDVEVPGRNQAVWTPCDIAVGVANGNGKVRIAAGVCEHGAEPVERPGEAAGPSGIGSKPLMSGLTQEHAGVKVKDSFVRGRAVWADQELLSGVAVAEGHALEITVERLAGGIEDQRDVHHDVD